MRSLSEYSLLSRDLSENPGAVFPATMCVMWPESSFRPSRTVLGINVEAAKCPPTEFSALKQQVAKRRRKNHSPTKIGRSSDVERGLDVSGAVAVEAGGGDGLGKDDA